MIRKTLAVVCLVLMLALSVIAVRSYWVDDVIRYFGPTVQRPDGRGGMTDSGSNWVAWLGSDWGNLTFNLTWKRGSPNPRAAITKANVGHPIRFARGSFDAARGRLRYARYDNPYNFSVKKVITRDRLYVLALPFRGFRFEWGKTRGTPIRRSELRVPITFLLVLLGAYPTYVMVWRWRALPERRRRRGLCVECGYNLRGNESGVCPECGASREPLYNSAIDHSVV